MLQIDAKLCKEPSQVFLLPARFFCLGLQLKRTNKRKRFVIVYTFDSCHRNNGCCYAPEKFQHPTNIVSHISNSYNRPLLKVCTKLPKLPLRNRLRKDPTIEQLEQIPFPSTALRLEVPKDPPISLRLKSIKLRLNIPSRVILPRLTPRIHLSALPSARSDSPTTRERAFISITCSEAVKVWRAIG
jgi:hypothetical protein